MKIKREFCGQVVEIELTDEEMENAYKAKKLESLAIDLNEYLMIQDCYVIPEELLNKLAEDVCLFMEEDGWDKDNAIEMTIAKYSEVLAYYKRENAIGFCG